MARRSIFVEIDINASVERVWALTQDPTLHGRWDLRFSSIESERTDAHDGGPTRFTYTRAIPFHTVAGIGISLGDRSRPDGTRTSALRFSTTDRLSPIRAGRGYWRYAPIGSAATRFTTGYDYSPGWGPVLDRVARPLLAWATAWSFDRLRIWLERGEEPERWPLHSILWIWEPHRPRAARCRRAPAGGSRRDDHLRDAPTNLATLADPAAAR